MIVRLVSMVQDAHNLVALHAIIQFVRKVREIVSAVQMVGFMVQHVKAHVPTAIRKAVRLKQVCVLGPVCPVIMAPNVLCDVVPIVEIRCVIEHLGSVNHVKQGFMDLIVRWVVTLIVHQVFVTRTRGTALRIVRLVHGTRHALKGAARHVFRTDATEKRATALLVMMGRMV